MPFNISGWPLRVVGCAVAAFAAASAQAAIAQVAPPLDTLLRQAADIPSVREADALSEAAAARVFQAGVRPNPELSLEVENGFGTGPFRDLTGAETTLTVSQDLELWGRRGARVDVARGEYSGAEARRTQAGFDAAADLAIAYAEAEAAQRRARFAAETLDLALADARAALTLIENGREPLLRGVQAEAEVAAARAALDEAIAERDAAFGYLSALAGIPISEIEESLLDRPLNDHDEPGTPPSVLVLEAERSTAWERIEQERIEARPDVRATVGIRRFELEDATAVTLGVSMPLPLFDRNRGNVDAAQAEYRATEARLEGGRRQAEAARRAAHARLDSSTSRVSAADGGVAAAQEAYRLTRIGWEAGRLPLLEVRNARAALVQAQEASIQARLTRVRAEAELARIEGRLPFGGQA